MSKLSEKQLLLATILVPVLLVGGVGYLAWTDYQKVYAAEITPEHPEAAEVTDPEQWGERRKCQEIQKEMDQLRGEAELIAKREQDVIVYREIVQRDSQILPDKDQVTQFVTTINDFERVSGVTVTTVADLNVTGDAGQAIRRLPIRLSLVGSFDQFLKFVNLFETMPRIVNTKGFAVNAGQRLTDDPSAPAVHAIQLELETYVYNSTAGLAKPVSIPNYERRKDDPVIQKLVRQQKAARVEGYQLKPRINRRDPLMDPRRSQAGPEGEGVSQAAFDEMKKLLDGCKQDLETLKEDLRAESQYLQEKKYLQYVQIKALNDDRINALDGKVRGADPKVTVPELREQFLEEVVGQFNKIAADRTSGAGKDQATIVTKRDVSEFVERQRAAFEARDYEKTVATWKDFENFSGTGNRKLTEDTKPLIEDMRERARQAGVMLEFVAMKLKVAGVIRKQSGSLVILNDDVRKVGDTIDEKGRCKLTAIKEESLVFDFDGLEIEYDLNRQL